jgi:hypothetical protein
LGLIPFVLDSFEKAGFAPAFLFSRQSYRIVPIDAEEFFFFPGLYSVGFCSYGQDGLAFASRFGQSKHWACREPGCRCWLMQACFPGFEPDRDGAQ